MHPEVDWPLAACRRSDSQDEGRPPRCKDCSRFGVGSGAPATSDAVPKGGDTGREIYYVNGVSLGVRWYFREDSNANAVQSYGWAEVIRWRMPGEGSNGTGVWFAPAVGSNIFINVGNTLRLASKQGALKPLLSRWSTQRNLSTTPKDERGVRELVGAELQGHHTTAYLAYLGYELSFDSLQFAEGSERRPLGHDTARLRLIYQPEIVMTSSQSFVKPDCCDGCDVATKARECARGPTTCGQGIELRKLSGAKCICSEQIEILNCDAEGPTTGTADPRLHERRTNGSSTLNIQLPTQKLQVNLQPGPSSAALQSLDVNHNRRTGLFPQALPSDRGDHVLGGLWPISDRLHLWSLTSASRGAAFLAHWLAHYARVGVQHARNTRLNIQEDHAGEEVLRDVKAVLDAYGVRNYTIRPHMNATLLESFKLVLLNEFIRTRPNDAYIIAADGDEFFTYPCDVLQRLQRTKDKHNRPAYASCAFMQDRVPTSLKLRRVQMEPPIEEQFQRCAKIRALRGGLVNGVNILKVSLFAARPYGYLPFFINAHTIAVNHPHYGVRIGGTPQQGGNMCAFTGRFSHYSMTFETQSLARQKRDEGYEPLSYSRVSRLAIPCNDETDCYMFDSKARSYIERSNVTCEGALTSCPATKMFEFVDVAAVAAARMSPGAGSGQNSTHGTQGLGFVANGTRQIDACGAPLRSFASRVHLWSMLAPLARPGLLPHWLSHYRAQGVRAQNVHLLLDVESKNQSKLREMLNHTRLTVAAFGVTDVQVVHSLADGQGDYETVKLNALNAKIRELPADALLIYADGDEFFEYPCAAVRELTVSRTRHAICGRMMERMPAWGEPAPLLETWGTPDPSELPRLFPLCGRIRRKVQNAAAVKLVLVRVRPSGSPISFTTAHIARAGSLTFGSHMGPSNCIDAGSFGHYALGEGAVTLAKSKARSFESSIALDAYMRSSTSQIMTKFASMLEAVTMTGGRESVRLSEAGAKLLNKSADVHPCPVHSVPECVAHNLLSCLRKEQPT